MVADTESTEAKPQAEATEPQEFYVDEEADQKQAEHGMSQAQSYAAFQKEKEKRKKKQLEIDKGNNERAAMQATIDELQATVGKITKGAPPTLESCDYDESQFAQKMQEYYSSPGKSAQQEAAKPEAQKSVQNEEAEFNPVTPYGRSKVLVEKDLSKLADSTFSPTFLRNATVYGLSPRHRFDLVLYRKKLRL